jgi:hypothetical protein
MRFALYGLNGNTMVFTACSDASAPFTHTFTYSSDITSFFAYIRILAGTELNHFKLYPQIEQGTSETAFVPYSNICPISGRDRVVITRSDGDEISEDFTIQLGQTVYGAEINWDTGVMTVKNVLVDMGDLTWTYSSAYLNYIANIDDIKTGEYAVKPNMYCSCFEVMAQAALDNASYGITVAGGLQRILARDADITDATLFTTAMTGQKICYELATPIELTLTPTELQMLKGYNRVTIDNGSIEVGYIAKIA